MVASKVMAARTVAVGDIHGDLEHLQRVFDKLPPLDAKDTIVFMGDYEDRGPSSREVIEFVRHGVARRTKAKIVCLRGNHEDAWLRVIDGGWPEFIMPPGNGALACLRLTQSRTSPTTRSRSTSWRRRSRRSRLRSR